MTVSDYPPVETTSVGQLMAADTVPAAPTPEAGPRVPTVTVVLPVLNEADNLRRLLGELTDELDAIAQYDFEVLVVDDGSTDGSGEIAREMGARVVRHATNLGNGAAVKRGIREADGDFILLMDGDGQHPPDAIKRLVAKLDSHDMVVGSRGGSGGSVHRNLANRIYNGLASYVTARKIPDLTSGFRVAPAAALKGFVHMLPNTFSYPTTITLAMFKAGYSVHYEPIVVRPRGGHSKINVIRDGSRFLLIILKVATMFSPLKVFMPASALIAVLGVAWYVITFLTEHRFTNMGLLLLVQASVIFGLGLVSEQIAQLRFEQSEARQNPPSNDVVE
ncbi:MAG: glycosyltransferase family 2 protein [Planctomycetota bacterium]|jgi:glycosyltransferase involved in cell wall biosynthesis|nr:glycosyltransferase family 2 protein [Planctomycetota bacterium]